VIQEKVENGVKKKLSGEFRQKVFKKVKTSIRLHQKDNTPTRMGGKADRNEKGARGSRLVGIKLKTANGEVMESS